MSVGAAAFHGPIRAAYAVAAGHSHELADALAYWAAAGIPAGALGDPADFGSVVAFLCSEHARFVVGAAVPIDGGAYRGLQ